MIKIIGENGTEFHYESTERGVSFNGKDDLQIRKLEDDSYAIEWDGVTYTLDVVNTDYSAKTFDVRVNGTLYSFKVRDQYDAMLKELGIEIKTEDAAKDIKAPMPGLVLNIHASLGSAVKKGDTILVLEAMKMENSIKAAVDGVVKSISVETGQAVEKNQVLVIFE